MVDCIEILTCFSFCLTFLTLIGTESKELKYELCRGYVLMYRNYPSITDINDVATMFMLEPIMMALSMVRLSVSGGAFGLMEEIAAMWVAIGNETTTEQEAGQDEETTAIGTNNGSSGSSGGCGGGGKCQFILYFTS